MDPELERTFRGHRNYIMAVSFSPSLTQLVSGSGDNTVMLWNFKPQLRAYRFTGHKGVVTDVKFSPKGDVIASSSKDKTVRLWTPSAKGESVAIKGHTGVVRSVNFSHDGEHLITSSDDKTAKIWSLPSRKFAASLVGHCNWVKCATFDSTTHFAATGGDDKQVKVWDVATHKALHTFYDNTQTVNCVEFHPQGTSLASGGADGTLKVWDARTYELIQHYDAHKDGVTSLSVHPSGYYMISTSKDSTIKIWDLREGKLLYTVQGHLGAVNSAAFSQDGQFFASGGADQLVQVWKADFSTTMSRTRDNKLKVTMRSVEQPDKVEEHGRAVVTSCLSSKRSHIPSKQIKIGFGATYTVATPVKLPASQAGQSFLPSSSSPFRSSTPSKGRGPGGRPEESKHGDYSVPLTSSRTSTPSKRRPGFDGHSPHPSSSSPHNPPGSPGSPKWVQSTNINPARHPAFLNSSPARHSIPDIDLTSYEQPAPQTTAPAPRRTFLRKSPSSVNSSANLSKSTTRMKERKTKQLPDVVNDTLSQIMSQLNVITRSISTLESRMALTEGKISSIVRHTQELRDTSPPPSPCPSVNRVHDKSSNPSTIHNSCGVSPHSGDVSDVHVPNLEKNIESQFSRSPLISQRNSSTIILPFPATEIMSTRSSEIGVTVSNLKQSQSFERTYEDNDDGSMDLRPRSPTRVVWGDSVSPLRCDDAVLSPLSQAGGTPYKTDRGADDDEGGEDEDGSMLGASRETKEWEVDITELEQCLKNEEKEEGCYDGEEEVRGHEEFHIGGNSLTVEKGGERVQYGGERTDDMYYEAAGRSHGEKEEID